MYKTFYQQANAQSSLQTTVAEKFGYRLSNRDLRINNKTNNKSPPTILAVIKPYALRDKELPYNQEVERLNLELDIIKNQRQRAANPSQFNIQVMQMLDQRIHQYNYLLEHKHLSDKNSNQTRKILKIQPKTEAQLILEKINKEKEQLLKSQNLSMKQQYLMNKNINSLYRKFKESMFTTKNVRPSLQQEPSFDMKKTQLISNSKGVSNIGNLGASFSKGKTKKLALSMINAENPKQIRSQSLQKTGSPTKNSIRLFQSMINRKDFQISRPRRGSSLSNKQNDDIQQIKRQIFGRNQVFSPRKPTNPLITQDQEGSVSQKKLEEQNGSSSIVDRSLGQISVQNKNGSGLDSPYDQRQILQRGKQLDRKIKNSQEIMDLWKGRIADSKHQMQKILKLANSAKKQMFNEIKATQSQNPQCENSVYLTPIQQIERRIKNGSPKQHEQEQTKLQSHASKIRQKKSTQKKLISSYLQKRNTKFMKPYGNKILIKYDSVMEASSMIDGNTKMQDEHLKEKQKQAEMALSMLKSRSKYSRVENKYMTDLEELQTPSKKVLQLDEDHYWAMAKNQKINLLIKSNKH